MKNLKTYLDNVTKQTEIQSIKSKIAVLERDVNCSDICFYTSTVLHKEIVRLQKDLEALTC